MSTTTEPRIAYTRRGQDERYGDYRWTGTIDGAATMDEAWAALKARISDLTPVGELPPDPFCAEVNTLEPRADGVWAFDVVRRWCD